MRVLIITYYWPPAGGSGVQRWLKLVKYLPEFGVTPVVFTAANANYPLIDESLQEEVADDLEVIKARIWEPNQLLNRMGKGDKASAGFLGSKPSPLGKLMRYIRANLFIPDARKFWLKPSVEKISSYLKEHEVDAVITTGPPHTAHLIGLRIKERFGISWIADFRDPWTEIDYFHSLPLTQSSLRKHRRMEEEVVKGADRLLVVGPSMGDRFKTIREDVLVIPNGYDTDTTVSDPVPLDDKFSLTHVGLMNADRNPVNLWKALSELAEEDPEFKEDLKIRMIGNCAEEVLSDVRSLGLGDNLEYPGYLDHKEVGRHQSSAQVLLLTVNRVPSAKGILTGKVFEYMQSNRPILAIGPEDGDLAAVLKETDSGVIHGFDADKELKQTLVDFYKAFKKGKLNSKSHGIEKYHRRYQAKQVAGILKTL